MANTSLKLPRLADAVAIPPGWASTFLANPNLTTAQVYFLPQDKSIVTEFSPKLPVEGPAAHAHGGFLASILDETMGSTCWYNGHPVLAANLQVRYRRSVPLKGTYFCQASLERLESKRAMVKAKIFDKEKIYVEASGLFIRVPMALLKKQPDMAKMVTVIETLKAGATLQSLIARDQNRENNTSWQSPELKQLFSRAESLFNDVLSFTLKKFNG